ncbi:unnamed protein product [Paramecium sonneborni]|uniref:Transmembrane protein n=1 Tax=Paramecium sonneborni TaxID=65129 RepID=A0A8S1Q5J3_9CILI|nr:unnamed protein product [Paramecium sonneborni]
MEDKQAAMIIFLILVVMLALIVSVKLFNFFRDFDNQTQLEQNSFRNLILNILEKTILLSQFPYEKMKIAFDEISYQINSQYVGYRFQFDYKGNWKFCKYKQEKDQITIFENNSNKEYKKQGLDQQFEFFSNIEIVNDKNYFYNQPISQQQINNGDISVLNIYILHLNQNNLKAYLSNNSLEKISILFLPSFILDDWRKQPTTIEERFQKFLFYFEPIQYRVDILYKRLFFIWQNQKDTHIILVEINFDQNSIIIHNTFKDNQNQNYLELCRQLNFLKISSEIYPSICPLCRGKKLKSETYEACFLAYTYNQRNLENSFEKQSDLQQYIKDKLLKL